MRPWTWTRKERCTRVFKLVAELEERFTELLDFALLELDDFTTELLDLALLELDDFTDELLDFALLELDDSTTELLDAGFDELLDELSILTEELLFTAEDEDATELDESGS